MHHDLLVDELAIFDRPADGGPPTDPAPLAVTRQELDTLIADAPRGTRPMLELLLTGHTQAEVAARLGVTENAVQKALAYYRRRLTSRQPA